MERECDNGGDVHRDTKTISGNISAQRRSAYLPNRHRRSEEAGTIAGVLFSLIAWIKGATVAWLVGGGLLGAVVPLTLLVIMPTNEALLDPSLDRRADRGAQLLVRWGRLRAVRSGLSLLALIIFLCLLTLA